MCVGNAGGERYDFGFGRKSEFGIAGDKDVDPLAVSRSMCGARAALKSGNLAGQELDYPIYSSAHLFSEGRTGALALAGLSSRPRSVFSLHGSTQHSQSCGRNGIAHAAQILSRADIQAVVSAIFNAPILPGQFQ